VLPSFVLKVPRRSLPLPLKALNVALRNPQMPVALITMKNRTLTPLAERFIVDVRTLAKALAKT